MVTNSVYPGSKFTVPLCRDTVNHFYFFYDSQLKRVQTGKVILPQFEGIANSQNSRDKGPPECNSARE